MARKTYKIQLSEREYDRLIAKAQFLLGYQQQGALSKLMRYLAINEFFVEE